MTWVGNSRRTSVMGEIHERPGVMGAERSTITHPKGALFSHVQVL